MLKHWKIRYGSICSKEKRWKFKYLYERLCYWYMLPGRTSTNWFSKTNLFLQSLDLVDSNPNNVLLDTDILIY